MQELHRGQKYFNDQVIGNKLTKITHQNLPFSLQSYTSRIENVRSKMKERNIDILLVKKPEDIRYLTNFQTIGDPENQTLIIDHHNEPVFICRLLEARLVEKLTWIKEWYSNHDEQDSLFTFKTVLTEKYEFKGKTLAIDHSRVSVSDLKSYEEVLNQKIVDAQDFLELEIRLIRTEEELTKIKRASELTEKGIMAAKGAIRLGALESEIYMAGYNGLISNGSEEPGYTPIIRTDEPAGHGSWEVNKKVKPGLVFIELSGNVHGHHAPMMRTCYILAKEQDKVPDWVNEAERLINLVFEKCLPLMKPGVKASLIDGVAREIMCSNSFGATMVARAGYTAGGTATVPAGYCGWGDACFSFAGNNHRELKKGQTFHFIPWLQKINGKETGPIGLSDTLVITEEGGKRMSALPLKIDILGPQGQLLN